MSYTSKDWTQAITKLIELTSNESIHWDLTKDYVDDPWEVVDRAFYSMFNGARYVVKSIRKRHYVDEDEFYWVNGATLEIYKKLSQEDEEVLISSAPENPVIGLLLGSVEANFAYQKGALSGLLDD